MAEESKELQVMEELRQPMALGEVFAKSGMFKDIKTASQAVVKIMAGKELGLTPFQSMASIYIVNDKLALTANVMASMIKKTKKYDYAVIKLDDKECTIDFFDMTGEEKRVLGRSTFTFENAAKAGLVNKDVWKNYPRNMLFARALSNGVRWYVPDAICGYYSVEEVQDIDSVEVSAPAKTTIEVTTEGQSI